MSGYLSNGSHYFPNVFDMGYLKKEEDTWKVCRGRASEYTQDKFPWL